MADLSTTAATNSPAGSESPSNGDDFLRAIQAIVRTTNAKGADIASAATTDIGAATGEFVDVTGTATITGLGTIAAGIVRTVRFTGALTLTHNATSLILPSSANIITGSGDVAEFRSLGSGNWKCTNYVRQSGVSIGVSFAFKNKIIGGDFTINPWQRGTSFPAIANNSYSADRWVYTNSSAAIATILKTIDAPTAEQSSIYTQHCLHIDVTTADASVAAADVSSIGQNIEGFTSNPFGFGQAGTRYVTLSFWHKHTKTGINCIAIRNSASDRNYIAEYTQAVSDTWEKSVITVPVDTTGTWLSDNGIGLRATFTLMAGPTFQGVANTWQAGNLVATANQVNNYDSTANNFKIALVQLEFGGNETSFDARGYGQELSLCERYFEKSFEVSVAPAQNAGTAASYAIIQVVGASASQSCGSFAFKTRKRASPTITTYNPSATNAQPRNPTIGADMSAVALFTNGESSFSLTATAAAGSAAGQSNIFHWTASAEL
jgi:hypothetical protein